MSDNDATTVENYSTLQGLPTELQDAVIAEVMARLEAQRKADAVDAKRKADARAARKAMFDDVARETVETFIGSGVEVETREDGTTGWITGTLLVEGSDGVVYRVNVNVVDRDSVPVRGSRRVIRAASDD